MKVDSRYPLPKSLSSGEGLAIASLQLFMFVRLLFLSCSICLLKDVQAYESGFVLACGRAITILQI